MILGYRISKQISLVCFIASPIYPLHSQFTSPHTAIVFTYPRAFPITLIFFFLVVTHVFVNETYSRTGFARYAPPLYPRARSPPISNKSIAKPINALLSFRVGTVASISTSSSKSATAIQPSHTTENGPLLSVTGKPRREVPLPSQEKKEGAMQYALYVESLQMPLY